ncbi:hypothetical protein BLOT_006818 [Blomia tropicalis]|nr:hypothetical protein BLOT_006818 [Blomia tropicalis]
MSLSVGNTSNANTATTADARLIRHHIGVDCGVDVGGGGERSKEIVSLVFVLFLILIGFSNSLDYHDIFQLGHHSINGVNCQRAKTNRNNQSRIAKNF